MKSQASSKRRGLFAKYFLSTLGIVIAVLILNGGVDFWFTYKNTRNSLIRIQHEKATAAAQRVEAFITEIEHQIGWTTHAQWAATPLEQRHFDFNRLMKQVPAIAELVQIDGNGREQLKVSRVAIDVIDSQADWSNDPRFREIQDKKVWFSPVYLRKGSEPYMSISLARVGRRSGATVAEVNLKLIVDVIAAAKVGRGGYTYVVDNRGKLIAHPEMSLVLRDTDMSHLEQVRAAIEAMRATPDLTEIESAGIARNLDGMQVLSAVAPIPELGWLVLVEIPLEEAMQPLVTSLIQTLTLLVFALAVAALSAWFLVRRMTVPIRALSTGAAKIGEGALEHRIDVRTGDELQSLADGFNRMAERLQESYAGLEQKVEERTHDLNEALLYQTAISDVLRTISHSAFDLDAILQTVVDTARRLCDADIASIFTLENGAYHWRVGSGMSPQYVEVERRQTLLPGRDSLVGRVALTRAAVHVADALADPEYGLKDIAEEIRYRTMLGVPLTRDGEIVGVINIARLRVEEFSPRQVDLVTVFADQAVIAIENVRLFKEIQEKSRQLEIASQHKSQFLANMSHELRTPLNAVLGYTELMLDGIYGEMPQKAVGVLDRIQSNGKHLLALINDVLDLSKIEAGQLKLALEPYSLGSMLSTVSAATESLATGKGLHFHTEVDTGLPSGRGDERRLAQVVLNLVGNAIKFTDKGEVKVQAGRKGESFEIAVVDTGPGIAAEDQARIFEEFQQVDNTSTRKKGGTGLGLAISRRIVAMHGGQMTVESELGHGSTFRITIPIDVKEQVAA